MKKLKIIASWVGGAWLIGFLTIVGLGLPLDMLWQLTSPNKPLYLFLFDTLIGLYFGVMLAFAPEPPSS